MTLAASELAWVNKKMETFPIIYQEIYDEILDHVVSAVETARNNGDKRDIESLLDEIVETNFGGVKEIRKMVFKNVMAYNKKISKQLMGDIKGYLNWQTIVLMAILIIGSFYLPKNKTVNGVLLFAVLIASFYPNFYTLFKTWRVKTIKRKMSLAKSWVVSISQCLTFVTYAILFVPRLLPKSWLPFSNPLGYSPCLYVLLLCFFSIYTLSVIELYKQVFKTDSRLQG